MLTCTFLGHQSWHFATKDGCVLVDPILLRGFGNSEHIEFEVYPPREIDVKRMPKPAAIFLSHEHLDHFHLPSIALLERSIPFIVGPTMPTCVSDAIRDLGFCVKTLEHFSPVQFGDIEVALHPASHETIFWEKRVVQYYIRNVSSGESCFLAVDAMYSENVVENILSHGGSLPDLVVVSNNSMIAPPGAVVSNALKFAGDHDFGPSMGLELVNELVAQTIRVFGKKARVAICGDGHVDHQRDFGPFHLSDQRELADLVNRLCVKPMTFGPYPGDSINIDRGAASLRSAPWITLNTARHGTLKQTLVDYLSKDNPVPVPIQPLLRAIGDAKEIEDDLKLVQDFLPEFARCLLMSPVGTGAVSITKRDWPAIGEKRILLRLLTGDGRCVQFALNICTARFELDRTSGSDLLQEFPYGYEIHLHDLAGILRGDIQVWDVSGRATRGWHIGNSNNAVESVLICLLGEQTRPDLHQKLFARAVKRISSAGLRAALQAA